MKKNLDRFWWQIQSSDMDTSIIVDNRIISLSVTETMEQLDTCSISILDPNMTYARIFRSGVSFDLDWGTNTGRRGRIPFIVNSPSGSADANGRIIYNMSGMAVGDDIPKRKYWNSGTKGTVIQQLMFALGCVQVEVDFDRMLEPVNDDSKIGQYESDFKFLVRLAREYRCVFRIGYSKANVKCGIFCDPSRLSRHLFAKVVANPNCLLEYGGGLANVINYKWQDQNFTASQGASIQLRLVNGKIQVYRYQAENQQIVTYRLNEEALQSEYALQDSMENKITFVKEMLSVKSFEEVKKFFIEDTITTAPQGSGMQCHVHMWGDINITAGQEIIFGKGFPDRLGAKDATWYVRSVTHAMSTGGYFCDLDIVDAYTFTPTGEML